MIPLVSATANALDIRIYQIPLALERVFEVLKEKKNFKYILNYNLGCN